MLRTVQYTRTDHQLLRALAVGCFTILMVISARINLEIGTVPFTMQVLVVLLAGMVLGARDGALSQISYLALIAAGLPYDARGLGTVALFGPTGGYLIGFVGAAFLAGWLVEAAGERLWQRWIAGIAGILVIYTCGIMILKLVTGMQWDAAWQTGVAPFIALDMVKALLAAGLVESMRTLLHAVHEQKS
jgi:biotin transport system substrate-specific component